MSDTPAPTASNGARTVALHCFSPPPASLQLSCRVQRQGRHLQLLYRLEDPEALVRLPPPSPSPRRRDGLWERTCLECFLARPGLDPYWEVNLSPCGDWALYGLSGYRANLTAVASAEALQLSATPDPGSGQLLLQARLDLAALLSDGTAAASGTDPLELAITAVIELHSGETLYWALAHSGPQPDFHRRADFLLQL